MSKSSSFTNENNETSERKHHRISDPPVCIHDDENGSDIGVTKSGMIENADGDGNKNKKSRLTMPIIVMMMIAIKQKIRMM